MGDDWFDDSEDDVGARQWRSLERRFMTIGFKDGIDEGQEAALQRGFNEGFRSGAAEGLWSGQLQGIIGYARARQSLPFAALTTCSPARALDRAAARCLT